MNPILPSIWQIQHVQVDVLKIEAINWSVHLLQRMSVSRGQGKSAIKHLET